MSQRNVDELANEVEQLKQRLVLLERRKRLRARWLAVMVLAAGSVAFAQLTVFTPDTPALASEVNGNFNQLKTWLEQKVGPVGTAAVTVTGQTTLANTTIVGTTHLTGPTTINGQTTITGSVSLSGRVVPNFDSGWQAVTKGNTYTFAHNLGAVPSAIHLLACGAVSGDACLTKVVFGTSGFNDGSSCINPINTFADNTNITVSLTSACNAWGYYVVASGFLYTGDADANPGTAFYRVFAWR